MEMRMMKAVNLFFLVCLLCGLSIAQTRIWRTSDGAVYEGAFEKMVMRKAHIRNSAGNLHLLPMEELSPPDLEYIYKNVPPEVRIIFRKKDRQQPLMDWSIDEDVTTLYTCQVRLINQSPFPSQVKLTAELFVFGEEVDGDNYVLVHREQSAFVFPKGKKSQHEFAAVDIPFRYYYAGWADKDGAGKHRGVTYLGYLVAVSDSQGNLIATDTDLSSQRWLREDLPKSVEKLREIAVNGRGSVFSRHFDDKLRKRTVPRMPWYFRSKDFTD
jgi:hypothetical protein